MAKVYFDIQFLLKFFVMQEEDIIVECNGLHFGKSLFHAQERVSDRSSGNRKHPLKKRVPCLEVGEVKHHALSGFSRHDEVSLEVANFLFLLDFLGSRGNHAFPIVDSPVCPSLASSQELLSLGFNLSAMWALNVSAYCERGDGGKVLFVMRNASRYILRRLKVEKKLVNPLSEWRLSDNFSANRTSVPSSRVCAKFCIRRIVPPPSARIGPKFIGNGGEGNSKRLADLSKRVSLSTENLYFIALRISKMPACWSFFMRPVYLNCTNSENELPGTFSHRSNYAECKSALTYAAWREKLGAPHEDACLLHGYKFGWC